ncbi:Protein N-acetyltransferase, RimJ/RimL family [Treponema bryantii]|uniref:Protein N-acetyltransferase, RimJ/RimL family n=1 Tax=Treponema bryantii TaxID=163 RepID=A0A1I3MZV7_9SPIR|nr:GNAT family N-acetyltransferase [Treponema bryantii]SFJ02519.1 Protein N-acetyltransferase, RimJ/RimL family [Treponema bryantii]
MQIKTERLTITRFSPDMAQSIYENSQDEDTRRFLPDEVYDSVEEAHEAIEFLMSRYDSADDPFVYPVITNYEGKNIGYVQLCKLDEGTWEIGYHIAKDFTGKGYATEAVKAFLPAMAKKLNIKEVYGICLAENLASVRVLEKCGFTQIYQGPGNYQGKEAQIIKVLWNN